MKTFASIPLEGTSILGKAVVAAHLFAYPERSNVTVDGKKTSVINLAPAILFEGAKLPNGKQLSFSVVVGKSRLLNMHLPSGDVERMARYGYVGDNRSDWQFGKNPQTGKTFAISKTAVSQVWGMAADLINKQVDNEGNNEFLAYVAADPQAQEDAKSNSLGYDGLSAINGLQAGVAANIRHLAAVVGNDLSPVERYAKADAIRQTVAADRASNSAFDFSGDSTGDSEDIGF